MTAAPAMRPGVSFARLLAAEARVAVRPRHLAIFALLSLMGALLAFWAPLWPETIYRFFARVFHIEGWSDIVLINNYTGFVFCLYWLGIVDLLRVYVQPLEESYLDVLLSKPIRRGDYMLARLAPSFAVLVVIGAIAACIHGAAMRAFGLELRLDSYAATIAAILAYIVSLLAIANLAMLAVRDTFAALIVAFIPFWVALLPGVIFMYRPDVYEGAGNLADIIVFPANMLWRPDIAAQFGFAVAIALLFVAAALIAITGWMFARKDAV